jgi:hypothetical protein
MEAASMARLVLITQVVGPEQPGGREEEILY